MDSVFVVDDNRNMADALVGMLGILGINAKAIYGSSQAFAVLAKQTPRLILLDVNMPGVDGVEVLAFVRREPRLSKVPVVIVTSDDQPETRARVLEHGAKALIIKPASLDSLQPVLANLGFL